MYPKVLQELMSDLKKLPGIGEKTAERLALYIATNFSNEDANSLSENLLKIKKDLKECPISHVLTDEEFSPIIKDDTRVKDIIMVVSDSKDVFLMEKMESYKGQYHVLGGLIDFSRGITSDDLNIDSLLNRVKENDIKELIIATNGTVEGELTAQYIKELLKEEKIIVSRLAYGLPVGTDLKYADILTLEKAVENRKKI